MFKMIKALFVLIFTFVSFYVLGAENWESSKVYAKPGNIVKYNNKLWKNEWWTKGDSPEGYYSNKWHVWRPVEGTDGSVIIDDNQNSGNIQDDTVVNPIPDGVQEWDSNVAYTKPGHEVLYDGKIYANHWWTQGDSPVGYENDPWFVWRPIDEFPNPNQGQSTDTGSGNGSTTVTDNVSIPVADTSTVIAPQVLIPEVVFAPYVDVCLWPTHSIFSTFSETSQKYYTLAFIQSGTDGMPMWGGVQKINSENSIFYADEINRIRENGGDVIVSFGGAAGVPLAEKIKDVNKLVEAYQYVIDTYKLKWIDFDVEGMWVAHPESIDRRNKAIKILQKNNPDLKIAYCLPVLPSGLTADGVNVLKNAVENSVSIDLVNIMTMDFGDNAAPPSIPMGTHIINSAENLFNQLVQIYPEKSVNELWKMIGLTPMIGYNDVQSEITTLNDIANVIYFAKEREIGLLSFWSITRDFPGSHGVVSPKHNGLSHVNNYDFTNVCKLYTEE